MEEEEQVQIENRDQWIEWLAAALNFGQTGAG